MNEYVAVGTKIRAMQTNFFNDAGFCDLIKKKDIASVAQSLRQSGAYKNIFETMNLHTNHRRTLEMVLRQNMSIESKKILGFLPRDSQSFVKVFFAKYEIDDIKKAARYIYNTYYLKKGLAVGEDVPSLFSIGLYSNVDKEAVKRARSFEELKKAYSGTAFEKYLSFDMLGANNQMFYFEMNLEKGLYTLFESKIDNLKGNEKKIAQSIIGVYCDMLNLQWIYRATVFYKIPNEVIFNYTLDITKNISKKAIKDMCYMDTESEVNAAIKNTKYSFLIKDNETTNIFMERRIERYMYYYLKKLNSKNPNSICQVCSYMVFLEFQLRDVISIIEAKKYSLPEEDIKRYLIRDFEEKEA